MEPTRNLLIVHAPRFQAVSDWMTVKSKVDERAPDIETRIASNTSRSFVTRRWQATRPSLIFSQGPLDQYEPPRGTVVKCQKVSELEQYRRLTAAGLPAPRTLELLPGMVLKREIWGEYVIVKPQGRIRGGSDIRLVKTEDAGPRYLSLMNSPGAETILVKRYIHSVDEEDFPIEYRVLTMFSTVLNATRIRDTEKRRPADLISDFRSIRSSDTIRVWRHRALTYDQDVIELARKVAALFPETACVGTDILRESGTGDLYVIEANSAGYIWNFSSERSASYDPDFRASLYTQFNALDLVADMLIEKTRREAS